ncbi:hypothetical protein O6H91_06G127300 [Diphasiastrum complanatum]|uniref:Uncharacterized protein n=1 Tax=Diphasiastrum complanatum TaxID=34168 RepID=A0ACC2DJ18_DIPCM|nr:hypothetical protein O6H91_06G127300 [Diphasiastrum complanatum]
MAVLFIKSVLTALSIICCQLSSFSSCAMEKKEISLLHSQMPAAENGSEYNCLPYLADPPISCENLQGLGSLDTACFLNQSVTLNNDVCIAGKGDLKLLPNISLTCPISGCNIIVNIEGNLRLGENASISCGTLVIQAANAYLEDDSALDTTGLGGTPPAQTSGTPSGLDGAGGGHGGRGACCVGDTGKEPEDTWGGDVYAWSALWSPWSYGSRGGSTPVNGNFGGGGGGRVNVTVENVLEVNGHIDADGGSGGIKGGGGSGGSILVRAGVLNGTGNISASGGNGRAGGGGGRVAIACTTHKDVKIMVHGGDSFACPANAGAAGTRFDIIPQSLIVSNNNKTTSTDTPLFDFPLHPLWANFVVESHAKAVVPLLWSRVQVRGQILLAHWGTLSFGLSHFPSSEFELVAEEISMTDSIIKVYGDLKLTVNMLLLWSSRLQIDGGDGGLDSTSTLEASNLLFLRSVIQSNSNLGMHGQGLVKLFGAGDAIKAQRLCLSLFYNIHVGAGALLEAPPEEKIGHESSKLYCDSSCPEDVINPPEDCTLNASLPFTLQICRVEDLSIEGYVIGSVVHVQRARTVTVKPGGLVSASGLGCHKGIGRGGTSSTGAGGGGGHGGGGGRGVFKGSWATGGVQYGEQNLPCELGSGGGNSTSGQTRGGGVIVMGSLDYPLSSVDVFGGLEADGEGLVSTVLTEDEVGGFGGGSGGSILLFLQTLTLRNGSSLSSAGGDGGLLGGGGGGGGRVHFHWASIETGQDFVPLAKVNGLIQTRGGKGAGMGLEGGEGTITGKECPIGLYGVFCVECPVGTYKNEPGSDISFCKPCSPEKLPLRAAYIYVRGGATQPTCPYECTSVNYLMPNCYTPLEELVYSLGGPWLFALLLSGLMVVLALVLSIARMKLVGGDDYSGPSPTPHSAQIDHSFPFLESLNEVLETNRLEESKSHVYRMYFMGRNSFSEPWHLPRSPPDQIMDLVYEDAFIRFSGEVNTLAAYQWWEGSVHNILSIVAYPVSWSWQQWRRKKKFQCLREYVRSEYDHSCLRSCRSRALYEGLKVASTPDLTLGHIDVFLGGDEKRPDLPPRLLQRLPMIISFGGDGTYMTAYNLHSDNLLTSLLGQAVPATMWYRMVSGLNAQLRAVRRGRLRKTLLPIINWLNSHANPWLCLQGVRVDLAWFHATASGYYQLGLVLTAADRTSDSQFIPDGSRWHEYDRSNSFRTDEQSSLLEPQWQMNNNHNVPWNTPNRRMGGGIIDTVTLNSLEDKKDLLLPLWLLLRNAQPIGRQALVGLIISVLLLADLILTLLALLQFYSISLDAFLVVLLVLPLASLLPFPAGINALFSQGPLRSAGLARMYNLWNITSLTNTFVALIYGFFHYKVKLSSVFMDLYAWSFSSEENNWWIIPVALLGCKCMQAYMVDLHIANLEIQDHTVYLEEPLKFWES